MAKKSILTDEEKDLRHQYNTITYEFMKEYILSKAPEDRAWFGEVAYPKKAKKIRVAVKNEDGTPKTKVNKAGKTVQEYKWVDDPSGATVEPFDLMAAKKAFCERYMPELLPKEKAKTPSPTEERDLWK